jgi:hypothetical protein
MPDGHGNRVRKYHACPTGPHQPTLWAEMEDISPENMKLAANDRRNKLVDGAVRIIHDLDYFNDHHNAGDPIVFDPNLTRDIQEKRQPTLFEAVPPDDTE